MSRTLSRIAGISSCAFVFCLAIAIRLESQWATTAKAGQSSFVKESWSRLSEKGNSNQIKVVQAKAAAWQNTKSDEDWIALVEAINMAAKNSDTRSDVTIDSTAGLGAIVKYQTLGQRKRNESATTAKTPTESHEKMFIGIYHIWAVREGKATSDENAQYEIANLKEKVMLVEGKKKK